MFAKMTKYAPVGAVALLFAAPVFAEGAPNIPVTVSLDQVRAVDGPLYVSIQKEGEYQGIRGHGGIVKAVTPEMKDVTYNVDVPGRYAVSLWHDLNDDGIFSMDENYRIFDGWGASGDISEGRRPTFDEVAVDVPGYGANVTVTMFYPE